MNLVCYVIDADSPRGQEAFDYLEGLSPTETETRAEAVKAIARGDCIVKTQPNGSYAMDTMRMSAEETMTADKGLTPEQLAEKDYAPKREILKTLIEKDVKDGAFIEKCKQTSDSVRGAKFGAT